VPPGIETPGITVDYHENPEKDYKTPKWMRRGGLTYYYRYRERILARAKAKRDAKKGV
jgi:hypothetical protein